MNIDKGDIFGFIGKNGAGKTTLIKSIVGIHDFDEGDILIDGMSIKDKPVECKKLMAYVPDNPETYEHMKAIDYINFICDDVCFKKFDKPFDIITAIMTLNNMPDAEMFFETAKKCLKEDGKMIIVIPHPFFWPIKHLQKKDISYNKEKNYEIVFATKGRKDYPSKTIYFHRSLETYIEYINKAGYYIDEFKEMYEGSELYPDILGLVLKSKNNI